MRCGAIISLLLLVSVTLVRGQEGPTDVPVVEGPVIDTLREPEAADEGWDLDSQEVPDEVMLDEGGVDILEGPGEDRYDSTEIFLRSPSIDALQEYRKDDRFDYDPDGGGGPPGIFEKFMRWIADVLEDLFGIGETVESVADVLPYIFFALALGLLIWTAIRTEGGRGLFRKKVRREDLRFEEEIRDIHELDFPTLLAESLAREDYRGAVRLHYLELLQGLSSSGEIDWRPEKTNGEYLDELRTHTAQDSMRRLTFIFDWVWYGEFLPEREEYERFRREFERTGLILREGST